MRTNPLLRKDLRRGKSTITSPCMRVFFPCLSNSDGCRVLLLALWLSDRIWRPEREQFVSENRAMALVTSVSEANGRYCSFATETLFALFFLCGIVIQSRAHGQALRLKRLHRIEHCRNIGLQAAERPRRKWCPLRRRFSLRTSSSNRR